MACEVVTSKCRLYYILRNFIFWNCRNFPKILAWKAFDTIIVTREIKRGGLVLIPFRHYTTSLVDIVRVYLNFIDKMLSVLHLLICDYPVAMYRIKAAYIHFIRRLCILVFSEQFSYFKQKVEVRKSNSAGTVICISNFTLLFFNLVFVFFLLIWTFGCNLNSINPTRILNSVFNIWFGLV